MKCRAPSRSLILIGVLIVTGYGLESRSAGFDKKSTSKRLEFRIIAMAEIIDQEATKAGFRSDGFPLVHLGSSKVEASDGEILITENGEFRSPEEAKRYFDRKVARSSKILTHGVKKDSKGKSVGYRAEVLLAPDQKESAVLWTNGAWFSQITAKSLPDA